MSLENTDNTLFLARQPIFDKQLDLFAYELLFRSNQANLSGVTVENGDIATSQVISTTFLEFGIDRVLNNKLGFINLTRAFITGEIPVPFSPNQVVLEILEDIAIDDEVIEGVKRLASEGYTIALDDFIYHTDTEPLIECAKIIKIDLLALSDKELIEHVKILKKHHVKLLAEKVETHEQHQFCQQLGFDYYQGYFFCKPTVIDDKPLPNSKITALKILKELQRPGITVEEIELLIKQDVTLSYKLLRYLNSAALALPKKVDSLRQAVIYLGLNTIKSWTSIIVFSNVESQMANEQLTTGLIRARMAELLAAKFSCDNDTAFMLGLFSIADALFNKPMPFLLKALPISESVKLALEESTGDLGQLISFIRSHERGTIKHIPTTLTVTEVNKAYLDASDWASQTAKGLQATP